MQELDQIIDFLIEQCWTFEALPKQCPDTIKWTFVVKLSCGVQARGHRTFESKTLSDAFHQAYLYAKEYEVI